MLQCAAALLGGRAGETRINWSLFRITADLSTRTQTRGLCIPFKNFLKNLKDLHFMKCLGGKLFHNKHDIFCFSSWDFREDESYRALIFLFFSCLLSAISIFAAVIDSDSPVGFSRMWQFQEYKFNILDENFIHLRYECCVSKRFKPLLYK